MSLAITINGQKFEAVLEDNATAQKIIDMLPLDLEMLELNGNEKYYYFKNRFPNKPSAVNKICAGDIMLYGDNCLVLFYEEFTTSYAYTRVGKIINPIGLKDAVGDDAVSVKFADLENI